MTPSRLTPAARPLLFLMPLAFALLCCGAQAEDQEPTTPAEWRKLDFTPLELIPVQSDARVKPLRVYAAEMLEQITGRSFFGSEPKYRPPGGSHKLKGLDLYFAMLFQTRTWEEEPIILIPSASARRELGLPSDRKRVSLKELRKARTLWEAWHKQSKGEKLTASEQELMDVASRISLTESLLQGDELLVVPHPSRRNGAWITLALLFAAREEPGRAVAHLAENRYEGKTEPAKALLDEYLQAYSDETILDLQHKLTTLAEAYVKRDPAAFKTAGTELRDALAALSPNTYPSAKELKRELHNHTLRPFRWAWFFYLFAGLLGLLFLRSKGRGTTVAVWVLFGLGLVFHLYGFTLRALIAGRAPVSNMYESVVWAALGCSLLGVVFEWRSRKKYFLLSSALASSILLLLMDVLPIVTGDPANSGFDSRIKSFDALVPVLKDHFWLAVHVLTITLSYGAFALAWILSHATLTRVLFHPQDRTANRELMLYVYDVLKAGVFLLALGTILGAFWGHYAWGRFWGWDSKETWSLITLLAYLFVLHMRFTGYWNDIVFAVGAVVCFLSVVMAWYGVNFVLGSGLHTYGTGTGGFLEISVLVGLDMLFVVICLARYLPHRKAVPAAAEPVNEEVA